MRSTRGYCCCFVLFPLLESTGSALRPCERQCLSMSVTAGWANRFGWISHRWQQTKEFKCHSSHAAWSTAETKIKTDLFYFRWRFGPNRLGHTRARTQNTKNRFFIIVIVVCSGFTPCHLMQTARFFASSALRLQFGNSNSISHSRLRVPSVGVGVATQFVSTPIRLSRTTVDIVKLFYVHLVRAIFCTVNGAWKRLGLSLSLVSVIAIR